MKTSQPLLVPERLKILQSLMPDVFDEGRIDWEKLRAVLGEQVNFSNERYVLNWAGKSDAFHIMQQNGNKKQEKNQTSGVCRKSHPRVGK